MNKLAICKKTREINATCLYNALSKLLKSKKKISELDLRDAWLSELRKHKELFPDGWYMPPPHGMGVLFGTEDSSSRVGPDVLRKASNWPRKDIFLDTQKGLALLYSSPVNKDNYIIGDFGLTIYFGRDQSIIDHFKTVYKINHLIFDYAHEGLSLKRINNYAHKIIKDKGLISKLVSINDTSGTNIGHSIPTDWTIKELELLNNKKTSWEKKKDIIANKRIFFNGIEKLKIRPGFAFTIEPRPKVIKEPNIPVVHFHTIAMFYGNGKKELLTGFDEIFKLAGMDYML